MTDSCTSSSISSPGIQFIIFERRLRSGILRLISLSISKSTLYRENSIRVLSAAVNKLLIPLFVTLSTQAVLILLT